MTPPNPLASPSNADEVLTVASVVANFATTAALQYANAEFDKFKHRNRQEERRQA
jgi:hypothetical protein